MAEKSVKSVCRGIAISMMAATSVLFALGSQPLCAATRPHRPFVLSEAAAIIFQGAEAEGSFLVVKYNVNFPGVTKIRMYSEDLTILYRSQFLDREKGDQKIYLRLERMTSGVTYYFELEFKGIIQPFSYTVP